MATSVVFPRVQFFANNGRPLIGGRIHTYVAGSSTRAPTYKDAARAQANTNPIILDGRGEASIYLDIGVEYKFVVEDSKGALLLTQEPVYGAIWPDAASWPSDATLAYQYMLEAKAAAGAIGPLKFYDTYAQAMGDIANIPNDGLIEISRDETRDGARTRYFKRVGNVLVFAVNLDQLRIDLSQGGGSARVGYDGGTAQDVLDGAKTMQSYAELRAYTGRASSVKINAPGISGTFVRRGTLSLIDNSGTIIIDGLGRAWERIYTGRVQAAWFGEDFSAAWAVSKKITGTPGVTYTLAAACLSDGDDVDIDAPDSTFIADGSFPAFDLLGGWEHIQSVTLIDADKFTVTDASNFAADDLIKIVDDAALWLNPSQAKNGEFTYIKSKSGSELTLVNKPVITFGTGNNCRIGKLKPLTCRVNIGSAKHSDNAKSGNRFLVNTEAFANQFVRIGEVGYSFPGSVKAISCYGGDMRIGRIDRGQTINGYGVVMQNSFSVKHGVDSAGPVRHVTDGIAQAAFTRHEFSSFGMNAYNEALNSNSVGSKEAAFTTHQGSYKNKIVDCWSSHGKGWVAFRGVGNLAIGGGSIDEISAPIGAFKSTGYTDALTDDNYVINPTVINSNQAVLVSQSTSGGILTITGGSALLTSTGQTRLANIVGDGSGLRLNGGLRIKVKGQLATRAIVTDTPTVALIEIDDVHLDLSECVLNSGAETFDIIDNNSNQADLLLLIDRLRVSSSQKLRSIYRSPVSLKNGCRLGRITVNSLLHAIQHQKTIADIQSKIDGPIITNFVKIADAL